MTFAFSSIREGWPIKVLRIPRRLINRHRNFRTLKSNILDEYVTSKPCAQNVVDIFEDQWSSRFPLEAGDLQAGKIELFNDPRMTWGLEQIGGCQGSTVLELGPLEAGHTYMLERGGASAITAVEANTRAFLKCLATREILDLKHVRFLLGDFLEYLRDNEEPYDICVANGVLYHMREPAELIYLISRTSDRAIIWTQYYDDEVISSDRSKERYFSEKSSHDFRGFKYETHKYSYLEALDSGSFCGGTAPFASWMYRKDILDCLKHFGFNNIKIEFDDPLAGNGPSFCIACTR